MRLEYDKEANALYIYLRGDLPEGGAARTVELAPGVYLDADGAGRILGVEFLDFADFRSFLERNGGRVDIPAHVGDLGGVQSSSVLASYPLPGRGILIGILGFYVWLPLRRISSRSGALT